MSKMGELWYEENLKGFEAIVKNEINGVISFNVFTGKYDQNSWVFQDREMYEDVIDGLYRECFPQILGTIKEVVEGNFNCLKKSA